MKKIKSAVAAALVASVLFSLTACSGGYDPQKLVKYAVNTCDAVEVESVKKFRNSDDEDLEDGLILYGDAKEMSKLYDDDSSFSEKFGFSDLDYKDDVKDGTVYSKVSMDEDNGQMSMQYLQLFRMADKKTAQDSFNDVLECIADSLGIDPDDYEKDEYDPVDDNNGRASFRISLKTNDIAKVLEEMANIKGGAVESGKDIGEEARKKVEESFGKKARMVIAVYQKGDDIAVVFAFTTDGKVEELQTLCKEALDADPIDSTVSKDMIKDLAEAGKLLNFFS